jgi:DNA-binding transcriptional regulator PaaX
MYKIGKLQKKILISLFGGVALGLSRSPQQYFKTLSVIHKDWKKVDQRSFARSLKRLSQEKLIKECRMPDGSYKLILTAEGKKIAHQLDLLGSITTLKKPKKWDGMWRIVIFDIPESDRIFRDILRKHLYTLEFKQLQHSVFISPYPCEKTILDLVHLYNAKQYVRVITATAVDNASDIKKLFFKK